MNVFISYASEQKESAAEIALALREDGYSVFFDQSELRDGEAYNAGIRDAISSSDLIVFLVSPEFLSANRYTLSELKFAEDKWPSPAGHVLPVVVAPTAKEAIPAYLRAVVILRPRGNVAAEVAAAVKRLAQPRWVQFLRRRAVALIVLACLVCGAGIWRGYEYWRGCDDAARRVQEAKLLQGAADYAGAWSRFGDALATCPGNAVATLGRERLAMEWLDHIRVTEGKTTFTDVVDKVHPVLSSGAVASDPKRAANALAHLGWGDFLRTRDGANGLDPLRYYQEAVTRDPQNPFAHAMWAHHILWTNGSLAEATTHLRSALSSGEERPFVRNLQIYAYLLGHDAERENEMVRVANAIRVGGEALPAGTTHDSPRWRIWNVYYSRLIYGDDKASFLAALPPADHLATFKWLYPEGSFPEDKRFLYLFMLAQLQELSGDSAVALATYTSLLEYMAAKHLDSRVAPQAAAAVKRLQAKSSPATR